MFYLTFIPNAFVIIKVGDSSSNFAYADAFGLYTHEYVQSSDYKNKYGGSFIWTDEVGDHTPENYRELMEKFRGIFKPTDIRMFLAFSNKEGINTLDYLIREMSKFLKDFGSTVNMDPDDFDGIIDLRE